ncbi:MAG: energy transducer TonB [Pseudomonadota bacterium]
MLLVILLAAAQPCVPSTAAAKPAASPAASGTAPAPPRSWRTNDPYPPAALRDREEGIVEFTLDIDAGGCPVGCHITKSSGHKTLDDATCPMLVRRARFSPAEDGAGTPIASTFSSKFRWQID